MKFCLHKWGDWSPPHQDHFGFEGKLLQATWCIKCCKVKIGRVSQPWPSRSALNDVLQRISTGRVK